MKYIRYVFKILLSLVVLTVSVVVVAVAFVFLAPTFGAKPNSESLVRMELSPHYREGKFFNIEKTAVDTRQAGESFDITGLIFPPDDKNPSAPLPSVSFDKVNFNDGDFVWLGHSTLLFRTEQTNVLIDPVFYRASPIPIGGKAFEMEVTPSLDVLPNIDVVLISHDHYDHLDHLTIGKLASTTDLFLVPLGLQSHLLRWGVSKSKIIELDWYESHIVAKTTFTLTPSRHFSGRSFTNRFSTLWGSWVVKSNEISVFHSGDSGYTEEFKLLGEKFGPFDIAFIENGAYSPKWSQVHMMPEQSVQAAFDLKATLFFPIHWGKFDLSTHRWIEPIERAVEAADKRGIPVVTPLVGQVFQLDSPPSEIWWTAL